MKPVVVITFLLALILAGCARSVSVLVPPRADPPALQANPVTFTVQFHPRADVSTFQATIDPPVGTGATTDIDITGSFSQPLTAGGQSTAVVTVPQTACTFLTAGCIDERRLRVRADMRSRQAFDSTGHDRQFRLPGTSAPPAPPPPAAPSISLNVTPTQQTVQWGNATSYQVELGGQNNFNGSVVVELRGSSGNPIPPGVSSSPTTVTLSPQNPNATATLNVSTAAVATPPGNLSLQVRASSPGVTTRTRNATLRVTRTPGTFQYRATTSDATAACGNNLANATFQNIGTPADPDYRVTFFVPPGGPANSTPAIRAVYYLFSPPPACVGVALHPLTGVTGQPVPPSLSWYNLGFSQNLGGPAVLDQVANPMLNWHQFWFSQDQSLLLLVTKLPLATPTSAQEYRLFLFDAATGQEVAQTDILPRSVGTSANQIADICRVELNAAGDQVTVSYRSPQSLPPSCPLQQSTTSCQPPQPGQQCLIVTRDLAF